jgi:hypothetical protein
MAETVLEVVDHISGSTTALLVEWLLLNTAYELIRSSVAGCDCCCRILLSKRCTDAYITVNRLPRSKAISGLVEREVLRSKAPINL